MSNPAIGLFRGAILAIYVAHGHDAALAAGTTPPSKSASSPAEATEEVSNRLDSSLGKSLGTVMEIDPTPLGEVVWIDSDKDHLPDTLVFKEEVIIAPRKAENGSLYSLHSIGRVGYRDQKTGKYGFRRLLVSQNSLNCQYLLLDFSGPEAWVSPRFPDEKRYPGWVTGCINATWIEWNVKGIYDVFYFEGPSTPILFSYNPKLKAVIGDIDPDDVPPHPECQSLVPQPFGAIEECMAAVKEREKKKKAKAKSQARPKSPN